MGWTGPLDQIAHSRFFLLFCYLWFVSLKLRSSRL